ncbi:hypothetical protein D3C80_617220 [compost metagenome]
MGIFRVDHQRHAEGLEAAPGQLRAMGAGRRRQVGAEDMGEVHATFFDQRAVLDHPGAAAATGGAGPGVFEEVGLAVLGRQGGADAVLQIEQVGLHGLDTVSHVVNLGSG